MSCQPCQERQEMLDKAGNQMKDGDITGAAKTVVDTAVHFVNNPPKAHDVKTAMGFKSGKMR